MGRKIEAITKEEFEIQKMKLLHKKMKKSFDEVLKKGLSLFSQQSLF